MIDVLVMVFPFIVVPGVIIFLIVRSVKKSEKEEKILKEKAANGDPRAIAELEKRQEVKEKEMYRKAIEGKRVDCIFCGSRVVMRHVRDSGGHLQGFQYYCSKGSDGVGCGEFIPITRDV